MLDFHVWGIFLGRIADQYVTLMTGGAIILALGFIERWLGRPVSQRTFVVLGLLVLFIACFQAWQEEYIKTIGKIKFYAEIPNPVYIFDKPFDVRFALTNATENQLVIQDIGIVLLMKKESDPDSRIASACKNANFRASMVRKNVIVQLRGPDLLFMYVPETSEITIGGQKRDGAETIIPRNETMMMKITYPPIDMKQFGTVVICPRFRYLNRSGDATKAVCEGAVVTFAKTSEYGWIGNYFNFEIFPSLDLRCNASRE